MVFCILGATISMLTLITLWSSTLATMRLLLWWDDLCTKIEHDGPGVIGFTTKNRRSIFVWLTPWNLMAISFFVAWIAILFISWQHHH